MTEYVLAADSASDEVIVGDKTLTKNGEPVDLTEEEYKSITADESVKLEEAGAADEQSEQSEQTQPQQKASEQPAQPAPPSDQTTEQSGKE